MRQLAEAASGPQHLHVGGDLLLGHGVERALLVGRPLRRRRARCGRCRSNSRRGRSGRCRRRRCRRPRSPAPSIPGTRDWCAGRRRGAASRSIRRRAGCSPHAGSPRGRSPSCRDCSAASITPHRRLAGGDRAAHRLELVGAFHRAGMLHHLFAGMHRDAELGERLDPVRIDAVHREAAVAAAAARQEVGDLRRPAPARSRADAAPAS